MVRKQPTKRRRPRNPREIYHVCRRCRRHPGLRQADFCVFCIESAAELTFDRSILRPVPMTPFVQDWADTKPLLAEIRQWEADHSKH